MSLHAKDAIVVLGCRVGRAGAVEGALLRRCTRAAQAYVDRLAPIVVVCGGKRWHGHAEAEAMSRALTTLGVPAERIHQELESLTTFGNARHGARLLHALGARRIAVVTSDFHLGRALTLFSNAGFDCVGLAAASRLCPRRRVALQVREAFCSLLQPGPRWFR